MKKRNRTSRNEKNTALVRAGNPYFLLREYAAAILVFIGFLYTRLHEFIPRMQFTFDQVTNSWVMKDILIDGKLPLLGMIAKGSTGLFIGPIYYYLLAPFYYLYDMEPIAGAVFALTVASCSFFILFAVARSIFGLRTALFAVSLYTLSYTANIFDRIAWPVLFIPAVSVLIFYCLYRILTGNVRWFIPLSFAIGFGFHIHFTTAYYLFIIFAVLPFLKKDRQTLMYIFFFLILLSLWFIPGLFAEIRGGADQSGNLLSFVGSNYHGFHARRFMQIVHDAFISYEKLLNFPYARYLKFGIFAAFLYMLYRGYGIGTKNHGRHLSYLSVLWFLVPWLTMSVYSGEITDYYYSTTKPVVLFSVAFLLSRLTYARSLIIKLIPIVLIFLYAYLNLPTLFGPSYYEFDRRLSEFKYDIAKGKRIEFSHGDPKSYFYFVYCEHKKLCD